MPETINEPSQINMHHQKIKPYTLGLRVQVASQTHVNCVPVAMHTEHILTMDPFVIFNDVATFYVVLSNYRRC